jgi:hypothetical protein
MEATSSYINRRRVHRVLYVFTDRNGVEQHGVGQTTEPWRFYAPNLTIEYDPQRPQVSRISGERSSVFGLFVLFPLDSPPWRDRVRLGDAPRRWRSAHLRAASRRAPR